MRVESPYTPISEPSPWWLKGLAIFMGIISLFMVLGTFSAIVSPILVDTLLPEDFEEITPYPVDGSATLISGEFVNDPGSLKKALSEKNHLQR